MSESLRALKSQLMWQWKPTKAVLKAIHSPVYLLTTEDGEIVSCRVSHYALP